jgi:hypothetical protein
MGLGGHGIYIYGCIYMNLNILYAYIYIYIYICMYTCIYICISIHVGLGKVLEPFCNGAWQAWYLDI